MDARIPAAVNGTPDWRGLGPCLHDVVEQNAQWYPDFPALLYEETEISWRGFAERMNRLAAGLAVRGLADGERVAVLADNSLDYVVLQYALSVTGGILVPINTRLAAPEIAYILEDSGAGLLLHDSVHAEKAAASAPGGIETARLDETEAAVGLWAWVEATMAGDGAPPPEAVRDWERPSTILYTGGTTGRPKGAVINHRRNILDGISTGSAFGLRGHERFLCCSPLSHTAAWDYIKSYFFVGGATVVLPHFDAGDAVRLIERHRVNGMWAVPLMLQQMIESPAFGGADLASLELIAYSAYDPSELMSSVLARFRERGADSLRIAHGYGLTEGGPFVSILRPEEAERDPASVGTPVPGVRVALLDANGRAVARGEVGEVCVRSAGVMAGYWNRPEDTAELFRGGWLHTGDLGRINDHGHLQIVDRKKDMIRTAGENVFAKEVESVLLEHDAITDCAVIGRRDDRYEERVVAIVVASNEASDDQLTDFARERLAGFKIPREIIRVDSLPKTSAGKTAKADLRKQYT